MGNLFNKKMLKSKTFWLALIPILGPLFPAFAPLLQEPILTAIFGAVMVGVRAATTKPVSEK